MLLPRTMCWRFVDKTTDSRYDLTPAESTLIGEEKQVDMSLNQIESGQISGKVLHLSKNGSWVPYWDCEEREADYSDLGGSRGYSTYIKLFSQGWTVVLNTEEKRAA